MKKFRLILFFTLHKYAKPVMKLYYRIKYRKDIEQLRKFFYSNRERPLSLPEVIIEFSFKAEKPMHPIRVFHLLNICTYLGYLGRGLGPMAGLPKEQLREMERQSIYN